MRILAKVDVVVHPRDHVTGMRHVEGVLLKGVQELLDAAYGGRHELRIMPTPYVGDYLVWELTLGKEEREDMVAERDGDISARLSEVEATVSRLEDDVSYLIRGERRG